MSNVLNEYTLYTILVGGRSPLGGVNLKSPGGGLRLGLSKKIKVKPLHCSVKMVSH